MGLDIYAGTLTRYYTQNWKNVAQQWAEANGYTFTRAAPNGEPEAVDVISAEEIQEEAACWRDKILRAIAPEGQEPLPAWEENGEKPYYTDKPDWDALNALLLFAACKMYGETVPALFDKGGTFEDYPVSQRAYGDERMRWSLFSGAVFWLPIAEPLYTQAPLPTGEQVIVSTVGALKGELEKINDLSWQASEEVILSWAGTEGQSSAAVESAERQQAADNERRQYSTESLAKCAYSMTWRAVRFSETHGVPILLDFDRSRNWLADGRLCSE
jgi:hypothetical protein